MDTGTFGTPACDLGRSVNGRSRAGRGISGQYDVIIVGRARRAACWPTACRPIRRQRSCCWRPWQRQPSLGACAGGVTCSPWATRRSTGALKTAPEPALNGPRAELPARQGFSGGCSSINGMKSTCAAKRGITTSGARWATPAGGGTMCCPYFKRSEGAHHGGGDAMHGGDGELWCRRSALNWPILDAVAQAAEKWESRGPPGDFNHPAATTRGSATFR